MDVDLTKGNSQNYNEIVRLLEKEDCSNIFKWSDPPGTRYPWHTHPHNEVRWILEGSILIGTEEGDIVLNPGDRLDVKANKKHWAKSDGGVSYVCGSR